MEGWDLVDSGAWEARLVDCWAPNQVDVVGGPGLCPVEGVVALPLEDLEAGVDSLVDTAADVVHSVDKTREISKAGAWEVVESCFRARVWASEAY